MASVTSGKVSERKKLSVMGPIALMVSEKRKLPGMGMMELRIESTKSTAQRCIPWYVGRYPANVNSQGKAAQAHQVTYGCLPIMLLRQHREEERPGLVV